MSEERRSDTKGRLLEAAVAMVAAAPGEDISLRAICKQVGVTMPTIYHFFGSKRGLLDAVTEHGFGLYFSQKRLYPATGDSIDDIRHGWDSHVEFGLANPGLYIMMYGMVRPGYTPSGQDGPHGLLFELTARAEKDGRLVVTGEQAAQHILTTIVGVTLRQIGLKAADRALTVAVREGVLAAITGTSGGANVTDSARELIEYVAARPDILGREESQLLITWIKRIGVSRS